MVVALNDRVGLWGLSRRKIELAYIYFGFHGYIRWFAVISCVNLVIAGCTDFGIALKKSLLPSTCCFAWHTVSEVGWRCKKPYNAWH